jgi:2,3,4,5-tetrahydropyridine-2-carboxylate N-succinyltransferase
MADLAARLEQAFEGRTQLTPKNVDEKLRADVDEAIAMLDSGEARVAEKIDGQWIVHEWLKKAVLLSFRIYDSEVVEGAFTRYFDKVPSKFVHYSEEQFRSGNFRAVPPAVARRGSFIGSGVVLLPSYVNSGAYVDSGTMVDTWATVGSCAQIGKNVHLSGGVGIGGVLEPVQASPTIIEDNCFIGARSEVVEGVVVEEGSVISMGVYLGQSTRI